MIKEITNAWIRVADEQVAKFFLSVDVNADEGSEPRAVNIVDMSKVEDDSLAD